MSGRQGPGTRERHGGKHGTGRAASSRGVRWVAFPEYFVPSYRRAPALSAVS